MIRLFVNADFEVQKKEPLNVKQTHYLTHVMRLNTGDQIEVFNSRQGLWSATVQIEKKQTFITFIQQLQKQKKLKPCLLCPALIKKEHMDFVLQKATELGATEIYPLITERTVVNQLNMERAQNILVEASEQCERLDVPVLHVPQKLSQVISDLQDKVDLIWLSERGKTNRQQSSLTPALFVGPEGGWTEKEQELFKKYQAQEWHLGQTILRAETACLAGLALCINKNE